MRVVVWVAIIGKAFKWVKREVEREKKGKIVINLILIGWRWFIFFFPDFDEEEKGIKEQKRKNDWVMEVKVVLERGRKVKWLETPIHRLNLFFRWWFNLLSSSFNFFSLPLNSLLSFIPPLSPFTSIFLFDPGLTINEERGKSCLSSSLHLIVPQWKKENFFLSCFQSIEFRLSPLDRSRIHVPIP